MRKWKDRVKIPEYDELLEVAELDEKDGECDEYHPPISVGFVNLYRKNFTEHVGSCGVFYAEEHIVPPEGDWRESGDDVQN